MDFTPSDLPQIVPAPAPARDAGRAGGQLFWVGVAVSLLLHGLIVLLFLDTAAREMATPEAAEPVEVVLVPPPQAPAPEEEPAPEEPAPEPEPEPEPEEEQEQEQQERAPEPEPEPEPAEEEEAPQPEPELEVAPPPASDVGSLPVLQPVEEFAEETTEAASGEEGEPLDGTSIPAADEPPAEEPAGENGEAERAELAETEETDDAEEAVPDTATDTTTELETGAAESETAAAEETSTEEAAAEEAPTEEDTAAEEAVAEPAPEEGSPETDILAGPEAEGETAPVGETAVDEAPASAPEAEGLSGAIATALPRAKPTPPPAALRAAEQDDLPPGVRLPGGASEPARRPGAPRLAGARELFSSRILGDSRARTAMAGLSGPQRLNLLCVTELRAQIRDLYPDRPPEILPSFRPQAGTVLAPVRAAYRSRGMWYDLDFRCETDPAVTRVERFSFRVGAPVPRSQWAARGFPRN